MFISLLQITQVLVQLQDRTENRVTKQNLKTVGHKVVENQTRYSWHCQFHSPTFLTPTISASTIVFVTYVIQVTTNNLSGFPPNETVIKATLPQQLYQSQNCFCIGFLYDSLCHSRLSPYFVQDYLKKTAAWSTEYFLFFLGILVKVYSFGPPKTN